MIASMLLTLVMSSVGFKSAAIESSNVIRGMEIMSSSFGSTYTLAINGEPVSYLDGAETTFCVGYPIHDGTNQYSITVIFPNSFHAPFNHQPKIEMLILTQESVAASLDSTLWERQDKISENWTVGDEYSYESDFVMQDTRTNIEFDALGTNKEAYVAQCKGMSIKLADLIRLQDGGRLAGVFGVRGGSFLTNCSSIVHSTNEVKIECIGDASKLSATTGDHLVLVYASSGRHLVSFTNEKAQRNWSPLGAFKHDGAYYIDSFVFGRSEGRWKFTINGCGWQDLNVDKLIK